jgi:hypothetical protein
MLKTTKDINKIITCSVFLPEPGEEVVKGILADYALLAASHRRLVETVKKLNAVHCKISQVVMQSIPDDEGNDILAALADAEELIKKEG